MHDTCTCIHTDVACTEVYIGTPALHQNAHVTSTLMFKLRSLRESGVGFKVFLNNFFAQFCINYANEKLHHYFILKLEQVLVSVGV